MTGMLISMVTMFFSTWFMSSAILKTVQSGKAVSSEKNETLTEKIKYGKDSGSSSITGYARSPGRSYTRTYTRSGAISFKKTGGSPFGSKLNLKDNSNPFAPKLSLRRPHSWRFERKEENYQQKKQYRQSENTQNTNSKKSSSPIISGYQNYIDILNDQMKD
jgi:hypothetical protein